MAKLKFSAETTEHIFEKIGQLPKVQRVIICCVVFIVAIGGFTLVSLKPKLGEIKELNEKYEGLERKLDDAKLKSASLVQLREEMKEAESQFKLVVKALPDKREIPSLLTHISLQGKDSGLEFKKFQPQREIAKQFYAEIPVLINVTGNYHNVALFFDKVSRLSRIVNINNINITAIDGGKRVNTNCRAVTYRFIGSK